MITREQYLNKITHCGAPPKYEPTPEEIAAECLEIQKKWSDDDARRRSGIPLKDIEVKRVRDTKYRNVKFLN